MGLICLLWASSCCTLPLLTWTLMGEYLMLKGNAKRHVVNFFALLWITFPGYYSNTLVYVLNLFQILGLISNKIWTLQISSASKLTMSCISECLPWTVLFWVLCLCPFWFYWVLLAIIIVPFPPKKKVNNDIGNRKHFTIWIEGNNSKTWKWCP